MKIFDLFENISLKWNPEDSCDVWISPSGEVYDLGTESCHLHYIREHIDSKTHTSDLVENGWIKLSNMKNRLTIEAINESLTNNKHLWLPVILEKAKIHQFELKVSIVDCDRILNLSLPGDLAKINLV